MWSWLTLELISFLLLDRPFVQRVTILLLICLLLFWLSRGSNRFSAGHLGLAIKVSAFWFLWCQPIIRYRLGTGFCRLDIELRIVCHRIHSRLKLDNSTLEWYALLFEFGDNILQQKLFLSDESLQVLISSLQTIDFSCGGLKLSLDC